MKKPASRTKTDQPKTHVSNLLNSLRAEDLELLAPHLRPVEVSRSEILCEPGDAVEYAYFPCGPTLVSYMVLLDDARVVETVLIGREGAVGGIVSQGHLPAFCQAIVQYPGPMLRIPCRELEKAKMKSQTLYHFFARYADCLLAQMFQSVACNATHTIEQRAAKWLMAACDRTDSDAIPLTQEHLAGMLGVGRSYVARVMGLLRSKGALETSRGHLAVRDIRKLKSIACSCNDLVRTHFDEVLSGTYPRGGKKGK